MRKESYTLYSTCSLVACDSIQYCSTEYHFYQNQYARE